MSRPGETNPVSLQLKHACAAGDLGQVRRLLDEGADPDSTDERGCGTLLSFHPPVVDLLLLRGARPDLQTNEVGASVLAGLSYMNQIECVRSLLRAGANANLGRPESGETPLHHALASLEPNRTALVRLLLEHGADPNARTNPGFYSFNYGGDLRTRGETPLHRAAAYAPAETIELLLSFGADPSIRDANGDAPPTWALWHLRDRTVLRAFKGR